MRRLLGIVCLLFGAGYILLVSWYPDVPWLNVKLMEWVWPVGVSVFGSVVCLLPRRFLRHDPALSAWSAVGLCGCLLLIPLIVAREHQSEVEASARSHFQDLRNELRLAQLRRAQLIKEEQVDRVERAKTDRFVQYEGRLPADVLSALRELDDRMVSEVQAQADAYTAALEHNPTKGPESWIRFRTLDQLEIERAAHQALYQQTRAFTQFVESFEDTYTAAIDALELKPPADRVAIAEMERILQFWKRNRIYDLRKLDVRLLATALTALDILRDTWGTWSYNPREKKLSFENPRQEAAFNEAILLFQGIALEVQAIQKEVDKDAS